jgi:hypothetical protein
LAAVAVTEGCQGSLCLALNFPYQRSINSSSNLWQLQQRRSTGQLLLRSRRGIGDLFAAAALVIFSQVCVPPRICRFRGSHRCSISCRK